MTRSFRLGETMLFAGFNRNFSEFLKVLHKCKSSLTCACACSLVTLFYLGFSISSELLVLCFDSLNKFFHDLIRFFC